MKYRPLNTIVVCRQALIDNYMALCARAGGASVALVVKSNAYGCGITTIVPVLQLLRPPFVCVDSIAEAYILIRANYRGMILIMGYVDPRNIVSRHSAQCMYAVFSPEHLREVYARDRKAKVHLFFDTGMYREGSAMAMWQQASHLLIEARTSIVGAMSHLAAGTDVAVSQKQTHIFRQCVAYLHRLGIDPSYTHIYASSGICMRGMYQDCDVGTVVRAGIAWYGYPPDVRCTSSWLKPAILVQSTVAQIKSIPKGAYVGYDGTYYAHQQIRAAIIPIGYNDGVDRRLSNNGFFLIKGAKCPIIGRVSMNITTVDISGVPDVAVGDTVDIYPNLTHAAYSNDTIPYELLVHLHPSTRRVLQ